MGLLADGGALADAGLITNMFIAAGTIGAATVAVMLGRRATRSDLLRTANERRRQRRQVFGVYLSPGPSGGGGIEVVNGSNEAIAQINLFGLMRLSDGSSIPWRPTARHRDRPTVHYLLGGEKAFVAGGFVAEDPAVRLAVRNAPDGRSYSVQVAWIDTHGEAWSRNDTEEPYATSASLPGRVVKDYRQEPRRRGLRSSKSARSHPPATDVTNR